MDKKYLRLLAKEYPTIESAASEIINLSAIRSLPKGTEYFFSDIHGEYEAFLHMLRSASGMIKIKIDLVLGKTVSAADREKLAELIYYPEKEIARLTNSGELSDEWKRLTIYRLILVCETVSAKYTRSRIRKRIPEDMVYILDELLNVTDDVNKDYYYDEIISAIISTGIAETFIISLCRLIQSVCIDRLHIIGDIFDRGPRADVILDELMKMHDVDIQWGNHDISWMGAAAGNDALIANVIRIAMRYNNFDVLEDGYGLNLRALAVFAAETYENDDCRLYMPNALDDNIYDPVDLKLAAKMHKAITVIQMKLEGQLIAKHPEWEMSDRDLFGRTDFIKGTVSIDGREHELLDKSFPTVAPESPLTLSEEKDYANDFMWYLWCGAKSPLYGKDKMAFFERGLLADKSLHTENYNAYYTFSERAEVCMSLLDMFGLDSEKGHIINGHVPVKIKNGESPVKAEGKLFVIDGGISKAYQSTTGIAGYTLIYDSHSLNLAEHKPFVAGESGNTPTIHLVEKLEHRANISDTDKGEEILDKINDLRQLLEAYKAGTIK